MTRLRGAALLLLPMIITAQGLSSNSTRDTRGYTTPVCQGNRQVIVHLFEWKWKEIEKECVEFLGPKGYCGVQVSPPNEHIQGNTWWTRYQPVSYKLESRSGSRAEFISMVDTCKAAGVNIYVDGVINHMSGLDGAGTGTGGSSYDGGAQSYPGVPFSSQDFNQPICTISNYGNPTEVRNCYLVGLNDLAGAKDYVRTKISEYLQDCLDVGVVGFRIDAAKHMWPGDIEATIGKVDPAFYVHEVIDQGGEPIKVQEYFGVGRVTEFRYGLKVAGCLQSNDFGCLGGVYDQGWGMADPEHAMVFIDNHDNQRGHGGAGGVLTHKDPYNYKLAGAFMLAHDYGFKRVMSSYYFSDKDEGPPSTGPGCGSGWACEHRWAAIGNMVEFTNAVAGTAVGNWVAGSGSLAFSRGNKGFFAMGNFDQEFTTGLPDGEYCDIISECQQKIQISGGKGRFKPYDRDEAPVAAICVGCGEAAPPTTPKPTTTARPGTTTASATTITTVEATTTGGTFPPGQCCDDIHLYSAGGVAEHYPELLGKYTRVGEENGRPVFKHQTILTTSHLHYTTDPMYKWEGWMLTKDSNEAFGYISNRDKAECPVGVHPGWEFQLPDGWVEDATLSVSCEGSGPGPTDNPGPTTTPAGPTDGPTDPAPGGIETTIVAVHKQTVIGSDLFIIGGVAPDTPIDISLAEFPVQWEKYNLWRVGDDHLDWDGPEAGQGQVPGENDEMYDAMGTPGCWSTDDPTDDYYYELNTFGPHYWFIVMEMDCSQTKGGWFEFNTIYSLGGEDGEPEVAQAECSGDAGGTAPFPSTFHVARCGYMNVFEYGEGDCQIDNIPTKL